MKKTVWMIGVMLGLVALMVACGDDDDTPEPQTEPTSASASPAVSDPSPTADEMMEETADESMDETMDESMMGMVEGGDAVVLIALEGLNDSGQSGWAALTAKGDQTAVVLDLSAGTLETELVHIHSGQCGDTLGGVVHELNSFVDGSGSSVTTIDASLDSLQTGDFAINSHKGGEPAVYTACGNVPSAGDAVTISLDELDGSGQSGWATLIDRGDTTGVVLYLSPGTLETELVHIHDGQCGDTLGGVVHELTSFVGGSGGSAGTVDASLDSLLTGGFAINSHKTGEPAVYTACGNVPAKSGAMMEEKADETMMTVPAVIQGFQHQDVSVSSGTAVLWTNADQTSHTVLLGSDGEGDGSGFDSGNLLSGETFTVLFDSPGVFNYTCAIHL